MESDTKEASGSKKEARRGRASTSHREQDEKELAVLSRCDGSGKGRNALRGVHHQRIYSI